MSLVKEYQKKNIIEMFSKKDKGHRANTEFIFRAMFTERKNSYYTGFKISG